MSEREIFDKEPCPEEIRYVRDHREIIPSIPDVSPLTQLSREGQLIKANKLPKVIQIAVDFINGEI